MNHTHAFAWTTALALALSLACANDPGTTTTTTSTTESSSSSETTPDATQESESEALETETGIEPDVGAQSCDVFAQDCADGHKCVPLFDPTFEGYACVPITGDGGAGEGCTIDDPAAGNDDCDATGFCFGYDQALAGGTCHPFCTGDLTDPMCIDGWDCAVSATGPALCLELCDPLADECEPGRTCAFANQLFTCVPGSLAGLEGDPCMFIGDCAVGLVCVDDLAFPGCAGEGCCTPYCSLMVGDGPCQQVEPGLVCQPWFEDPPAGYEDVGVCVAP